MLSCDQFINCDIQFIVALTDRYTPAGHMVQSPLEHVYVYRCIGARYRQCAGQENEILMYTTSNISVPMYILQTKLRARKVLERGLEASNLNS